MPDALVKPRDDSIALLRSRDAREWIELARQGEFERAWRVSDRIRACSTEVDPSLARHLQQIWDGTDLHGQRVLIRCYHGLGDTIQFIRYAPLVRARAREVIVWAQPSLLSLLRTVRGIDRLLPLHDGSPDVDYDVDVEVMELPYVFRTTLSTIPRDVPYLCGTGLEPRFSRESLDTHRPRIGLVWRAGTWDQRRSIPFACLGPLLKLDVASWYAFHHGIAVGDWHPNLCWLDCNEVQTTADYMSAMDLVITVDSMTAHLAGALGVAVWTLLPSDADWRWMRERSDSPWYPTMRLFRQVQPGMWDEVIAEVRAQLFTGGLIMPTKVQRGGEAEPDGPRKPSESEKARREDRRAEKPADRGEGKVAPRTPGKAEGE